MNVPAEATGDDLKAAQNRTDRNGVKKMPGDSRSRATTADVAWKELST
jgi:hypothetical protein